MVKFYDTIPPELVPWLLKQELFWVATAPLGPEGHINVSPKGVRDSFHVVSPTRVWYQDLSGSGVETISHIRENGRMTIMFSAFDGPPRIMRLFGTGSVHEFGSREYEALIPPEERRPGSRAAIVLDVHKVSTSCGYAVPYYDFRGHRNGLLDFFDKRERTERAAPPAEPAAGAPVAGGLKAYWADNNARSLDGLPGLRAALCAPADVPFFEERMRRAGAVAPGSTGNGCVNVGKENGHANGKVNGVVAVMGLGSVDRRRVEDWAVAFVLGVGVAAVYAKVAGAV